MRNSYLTLVGSVVPFLDIFDLQGIIIRAFSVQNLKSFIVGVCEYSRRQDMPVSSSNPGYLLKTRTYITYISK